MLHALHILYKVRDNKILRTSLSACHLSLTVPFMVASACLVMSSLNLLAQTYLVMLSCCHDTGSSLEAHTSEMMQAQFL